MPYNQENLLKRIAEIQEVVLEHKKKFMPQKQIYKLYIKEQYRISYSCFNRYLGIPARKMLMELLKEKQARQ